jgi:GGDEF domain-containing protein
MAAMGGGGDIHSRLAMAAAACRQARMPLSLVLVALEAAPEASAEEISRLRDAVALACQELDHPSKICLTHGPGQFAIILPQRDRQEAVSLANSLMESVRSHSPAAHGSDARRRPSVSVGLAGIPIVPRNFPVADLLDAAHRCLNASRASGGGVVKSIEIF